MLPAIIGALGAVGGGLLTANSINEQNAMANSQFRANYDFQRYQYEDMKRWQSPENLVRLYRQAGLNPALALGSGLNAPATSVGGVAPTASHAVGDFSGVPSAAANLMQGFANSSLAEAQERNVDANTENVTIRNQNQLRSDLADINLKLSNKRLNDVSRKRLMLEANYIQKQLDYADERLNWENQEQRFKATFERLARTLEKSSCSCFKDSASFKETCFL